MSRKFIDLDKLNRLSKSLDDRSKAAVKAEEQRALAAEQALQTAINGKAASGHTHDDRYYTESEINTKVASLQAEIDTDVKAEADRAKAAEAGLQAAIDGKSASGHTHDDRYYTESEMNTKLSGKSDVGHDHDDDYYTEAEIDSKISTINTAINGKANASHGNHVPAVETANNAKFLRNDNTWATVTPDNIGAAKASHGTHVTWATNDPKANGTASVGSVARVAREDHIHPLQTSVSGNAGTATKLATERTITIGNKGNTFDGSADIAFTLSEIGASASGHSHDDRYYTESEINTKISDLQVVIDTKASANHGNHVPSPQTANNAKFLRNDNTWQTVTPANIGASASGHTHDDIYYTETEVEAKITTINTAISTAQTNAQKYADDKISALVNSAPDALNTLKELADAITDHQDVYDAYVEEVSAALSGKSDTGHTHNYAGSSSAGGAATSANKVNSSLKIQINGGTTEGTNQFTFNGSSAKTINITPDAIGAAGTSHGTHVTYASATPLVAGTGAVGSSTKVAREDHVHPAQTSVSGNAGTATTLKTARNINGTSFDGSGNITTANWGSSRNISISDSDGTNTGAAVSVNGSANATLKLPATIKASLTGNADTATKAGKWSTARTLTIGSTGKTVDGSDNVSWSLSEIGALPISGGTVTGDTVFNKYLSVSAWPGYGSGSVDMWYDGTYSSNIGALTLNKSIYTEGAVETNNLYIDAWPGYGTGYSDLWYDGANKILYMDHVSTILVEDNKVYHEGYKPTYSDVGAAAESHGTHVTYSTTAPKVAGTASVGSETSVARGDHVHPAQTSVSGNAGTATKLATPVTLTIGAKGKTFDGSGNVSWSLAEIGAYSNKGGALGGTINYQFTGTGGHAIGLDWTNNDTNKTKFGGIGGLANAGVGTLLYMGWGAEPWSTANNFSVSSSAIKYKNNKIYHAGDKPTLSELGAAAESHGTHVTYATATPKANGTAAIGSVNRVAREDHVHPLQTSVSGNAGTATKLAAARTITIGNKGKTFDGSADVAFTLAEIGAEPLTKTVVSKTKSGTTLTLSTDRYQKASLASGDTIALPSVSVYTEIELFVKDCSLTNINLPDNCKWRLDQNLQTGTSFIIRFVYTTQEWLGEIKIFS